MIGKMFKLLRKASLLKSKVALTNTRSALTSIISHRSFSSLLKPVSDPRRKNNLALVDDKTKQRLTYQQLDEYSSIFADYINKNAAWKLKKVFVPLSVTHSSPEVEYFIEDSHVTTIICAEKNEILPDIASKYATRIISTALFSSSSANHPTSTNTTMNSTYANLDYDTHAPALILYTSGTTGRPKGVVHTHHSLEYMMRSLIKAWEYTAQDHILHFLPLYHMHGFMNKCCCLLYVGGSMEFLPSAKPMIIWERLARDYTLYHSDNNNNNHNPAEEEKVRDIVQKPITLFMAVPTVYATMLEAYYKHQQQQQQAASSDDNNTALLATIQTAIKVLQPSSCSSATTRMRLMVSGTAALPDTIMDAWYDLTGQRLLERYGMTEIGMALSNPYQPITERIKGQVGQPLPYVSVRLVNEQDQVVKDAYQPGELQIAGPCLFAYYLNQEKATKESFVMAAESEIQSDDSKDSKEVRWFKTGDIAEVNDQGVYRILGRNSTDIIKSAGYKISALEIEREILSHSSVIEAAVVGQADEKLGEVIIAIVVLRGNNNQKEDDDDKEKKRRKMMENHLQDCLAKYKQPRLYYFVEAIPRNYLGKVNKKTLLKDLKIIH